MEGGRGPAAWATEKEVSLHRRAPLHGTGARPQVTPLMRRDMNKSEIRSTKSETSSNDQNPNDQNNRTCTFQVSSFLSFENSNLNSFVSNFDIRDSDFQAMISHRIDSRPDTIPLLHSPTCTLYFTFASPSLGTFTSNRIVNASVFLKGWLFDRIFQLRVSGSISPTLTSLSL